MAKLKNVRPGTPYGPLRHRHGSSFPQKMLWKPGTSRHTTVTGFVTISRSQVDGVVIVSCPSSGAGPVPPVPNRGTRPSYGSGKPRPANLIISLGAGGDPTGRGGSMTNCGRWPPPIPARQASMPIRHGGKLARPSESCRLRISAFAALRPVELSRYRFLHLLTSGAMGVGFPLRQEMYGASWSLTCRLHSATARRLTGIWSLCRLLWLT